MSDQTFLESDHLRTLLNISSSLNSSLDLDEVLNNALDAVLKLLHAERGLIMIESDGTLSIKVTKSFLADDVEEGREISHGVIEEVYQNGKPIITINAMDDQRFSGYQSVVMYQLRSVLCVPIQSKDDTIGIIYLDNRWKTGIFSERDLETLTTFANHAASAIVNAKLYRNLQNSINEQLKLQEEVYLAQLRTEVERETNKLRSELAQYLVHDLRNPLTSVFSAFGILEGKLRAHVLSSEENILVERARQNLKLIADMLSDILDVYQLENNELALHKEPFDLKASAKDALEMCAFQKSAEVSCLLDCEMDEWIVNADRELISRVLSNLIQNACKWTKTGEIKIRITKSAKKDASVVQVCDTGDGMPEALRNSIFSKYLRVQRKHQTKGSRGLGLAFCRLAVNAHAGAIRAFENPGGGTVIEFFLPDKSERR